MIIYQQNSQLSNQELVKTGLFFDTQLPDLFQYYISVLV